jgi:Protein of unknown function (DUF3617)
LTKTLSIGLTMLFCATMWAADFHPLNVKPGQWETTVSGQMTGMPPIPAEALSRMTPEQRARIEAAMGARGAKPMTSKTCLTKESLDKALNMGSDESVKSCTRTLTTSTSGKQEIQMECDRNGIKTKGTVVVEAVDSETIRGSMKMTTTSEANRTMNMDYTFTSKWVGGACTEKP